MPRWKKIIRRTLLSGGIIAAVVLVLLLLLPYLVNFQWIKQATLTRISQTLGGDVGYRRMELHFLPFPRAVIYGATFSFPKGIQGEMAALKIYPRLWSLLKGEIHITTLRFDSPRLEISPEIFKNRSTPTAVSQSPFYLIRMTEKTLGSTVGLFQGITVHVSNGQLTVKHPRHDSFAVTGLMLHMKNRSNKIDYTASCTSNMWQKMHTQGWIDTDTLEVQGQFQGKGIAVHEIAPHLSSAGLKPVKAAVADIQLSYRMRHPHTVEIDFQGRFPTLVISRRNVDIPLAIDRLKGRFNFKDEVSHLSVPQMVLSGGGPSLALDFRMDPGGSALLTLNTANTTISRGKAICLAVLGNNRIYRPINHILKKGVITELKLEIPRDRSGRWQAEDQLKLWGHVQGATIYVPGANITVNEARGAVAITGGIFRATQLSGRMQGATGRQGYFQMALSKRPAEIKFTMLVESDVAHLVDYVSKSIRHPTGQKIVRQLSHVQGRTAGRFSLTGTTTSLQPTVAVSHVDFSVTHSHLPHPLHVRDGTIQWGAEGIQAQGLTVSLADSIAHGVTLEMDWQQISRMNLRADAVLLSVGQLGDWLATLAPGADVLMGWSPQEGIIRLRDVTAGGPLEDATLWSYNLAGKLQDVQLQSLRGRGPLLIAGATFRASGPLPPRLRSGTLEVNDLRFRWDHSVPLDGRLSFRVGANPESDEGGQIDVTSADLRWNGFPFALEGTITPQKGTTGVDLDLNAPHMDWDTIQEAFKPESPPKDKASAHAMWPLPISGTVRTRMGAFQYKDHVWRSVQAELNLNPQELRIDVSKAELCGVDMPSLFVFTPEGLRTHMYPRAQDLPLALTAACLWKETDLVTGQFSLHGNLSSATQDGSWVDGFEGKLFFQADRGRIHRYGIVAKILALLNVAGLLQGKLPDMQIEGFAYETMVGHGDVRGATLHLKDFVIQGNAMDFAFLGEIDVRTQTADLDVLVTPFKTLDLVVKYIPVINNILNNRFVSIPFKVTGALADPNVQPLPVLSVRDGLLTLMKNVFHAPLRVVQPLFSKEATDSAQGGGEGRP